MVVVVVVATLYDGRFPLLSRLMIAFRFLKMLQLVDIQQVGIQASTEGGRRFTTIAAAQGIDSKGSAHYS